MQAIIIAAGCATIIPALTLNFHWFYTAGYARWAGWASMGCAAAGVFCFVLAGNMRP